MSKIVKGKIKHEGRLERKPAGKTSKLVYPVGYYGASLRGIRIAPQKVRLVIDQIRGLNVDRARQVIRYSQKRAAYYIDRVVLSAIGNADVKSEGAVSAEDLIVVECYVDEGPRLKRFLAGPMGRARPILRRMCHITVVLATPEAFAENKQVNPAPSRGVPKLDARAEKKAVKKAEIKAEKKANKKAKKA